MLYEPETNTNKERPMSWTVAEKFVWVGNLWNPGPLNYYNMSAWHAFNSCFAQIEIFREN